MVAVVITLTIATATRNFIFIHCRKESHRCGVAAVCIITGRWMQFAIRRVHVAAAKTEIEKDVKVLAVFEWWVVSAGSSSDAISHQSPCTSPQQQQRFLAQYLPCFFAAAAATIIIMHGVHQVNKNNNTSLQPWHARTHSWCWCTSFNCGTPSYQYYGAPFQFIHSSSAAAADVVVAHSTCSSNSNSRKRRRGGGWLLYANVKRETNVI